MRYAFTKDNDGTTRDAGADYSGTPGYFLVVPTSGLRLRELCVEITGTTAFDETKFGPIAAITNGLKFQIANLKSTGVYEPLKQLIGTNSNPITIKSLADFLAAGFQVSMPTTKTMQARLPLTNLQVNAPKQLIMAAVTDNLSDAAITTVRFTLEADDLEFV